MKWNDCGTMVGENGNMNISIEEVEKLSVLYTLYLQPIITQYFASNKSEIWP